MTWQTAALELGLGGWIVVLLLGDVVLGARPLPRLAPRDRSPRDPEPSAREAQLWKVAVAGIGALGAILWWQRAWVGQSFDPAGGMFAFDRFAYLFKWLFLLTALAVVLMTRAFARQLTANIGEFYLLIFAALLGMCVLASATDLLLLFIGLELLTFSLYVMAAYLKTDGRSIEASMKYLIMGSVSSGFLIYGVSLLYGAAGGTGFAAVRQLFASGAPSALANAGLPAVPVTAQAGLLLVIAGLGFKIAAVPFHLWVPDVYEGAPTPVAALLAVGSKMAGVMVLLRLLYAVCLPAQALWGSVLAVLAAATMCYGNLAAIPQTNIKRLLGYSSIGHAGYLLMGLSTATSDGAQAVGMYLLAYLCSNLAAFFVVTIVSQAPRDGAGQAVGGDSLEDFNGLAKRSPLLAASLFIALLSLAGVPPLAGFVGKLLVLLSAVEDQRLWLVAVGALNVAISLYYYLMVIRRAYLYAPASTQPIAVDRLSRVALYVLLAGIIAIGIVQAPFLRLVSSAIAF